MATTTVIAWLAEFDSSLQAQDVTAAVAQFDDDNCYWRDLLTFTNNIRTEEGPAAIRAMLEARLSDTSPSAFQIEGQATETADGVIEAFFAFETAIARGRGHLRLKAGTGKAWTLLTTMAELKGFEEKKVSTHFISLSIIVLSHLFSY
jgi:putative flavoprotein involved in K+ transport